MLICRLEVCNKKQVWIINSTYSRASYYHMSWMLIAFFGSLWFFFVPNNAFWCYACVSAYLIQWQKKEIETNDSPQSFSSCCMPPCFAPLPSILYFLLFFFSPLRRLLSGMLHTDHLACMTTDVYQLKYIFKNSTVCIRIFLDFTL